MKHVLDTFMLSDCDFLANQNMRKIRALVCDFLTVSDILDICAMHKSCESTCDFLTASDFPGKQFLNPTQKTKIYLHGDPFLVKACFVNLFFEMFVGHIWTSGDNIPKFWGFAQLREGTRGAHCNPMRLLTPRKYEHK